MPDDPQEQLRKLLARSQQQTGFISPGTETLLSVLPALVGAYEGARGRPVGAPMTVLGALGLEHAGTRQTQQQGAAGYMAQLDALSKAGQLSPQQLTEGLGLGEKILGGTLDPASAMKALELSLTPKASTKRLIKTASGNDVIHDLATDTYTTPEGAPVPPEYWKKTAGGFKFPAQTVEALLASGVDPTKVSPTSPEVAKAIAAEEQRKITDAIQRASGVEAVREAARLREPAVQVLGRNVGIFNKQTMMPDPTATYASVKSGRDVALDPLQTRQYNSAQEAIAAMKVVSETAKQATRANPDIWTYTGAWRAFKPRVAPELFSKFDVATRSLADTFTRMQIPIRTSQAQMKGYIDTLSNPHSTFPSTMKAVSGMAEILGANLRMWFNTDVQNSTLNIIDEAKRLREGTSSLLEGTEPPAAPDGEGEDDSGGGVL